MSKFIKNLLKMKKFYTFAIVTLMACAVKAQDTYFKTIDNVQAKKIVDGSVALYYHYERNNFRFFVEKDNEITELKDERAARTSNEEDYKAVLNKIVANDNLSADYVPRTIYGLKDYLEDVNKSLDDDYKNMFEKAQITVRMGVFSGLSNNIYRTNVDNVYAPTTTLEFEFSDKREMTNHGAFVQFKHSFSNNELNYSATQFSINYRYSFLNTTGLRLFGNAKMATVTYAKSTMEYLDENEQLQSVSEKGFAFDTPVSVDTHSSIQSPPRATLKDRAVIP